MQRNTLFVYVRVFVCKWVCENARVFVCECVYFSVCYNREQSTLAKIQIKKLTFSIIDDLI